jgi:DNA polymerase III delta prime subunit
MTNEAQNALLKTLEEPPADAMFFFIVPAPEVLLPTLRSRAQILTLRSGKKTEDLVDAKKFLAAPVAKRLEMLKPLLEKDDDDKRDTGEIIRFLGSLERLLEKKPEGLARPATAEGVDAVYRARKYMGDKGALVKPLLEQVALLV